MTIRGFWKGFEIYVKAIVNLLIFCAGVMIFIYLVPRLLVFFMPFVVGGIIAAISNPLVRFFERTFKIRRRTGTAVVIIAVIALVIILGYLLVVLITRQLVSFMNELPGMWAGMQIELTAIGGRLNRLFSHFPKDMQFALRSLQDNLGSYLGDMVTAMGTPTFEAVGGFFKNLPSIIVGIVMCLLSAYFFVAERDHIGSELPKHLPAGLVEKWHLVWGSLRLSVGGYFKAQLKIEIWIYLLLVAGFFILGVEYAMLIAIGIAALDFFPIFGTGTILIPWAVIKLLNADYVNFVGLIIMWGVGQLVRQIIQPKIMGDTIGVSPIPTLFLLYIGYQLAGVMGMIVALPIGIIIRNLYQAGLFETTKESLKILFNGVNRFRRIDASGMKEDSKHRKE